MPYNTNRLLSSGKIDKYEYLMGEGILPPLQHLIKDVKLLIYDSGKNLKIAEKKIEEQV